MILDKLNGRLLVSLPTLKSGVFAKSIVFIQAQDQDGAVGFVLNKKYPTSKSKIVAQQLGLPDHTKIFFGGPVNTHSGFVLHSDDYHNQDTVQLMDNVFFTPGKQIINDLIEGTGPQEYMIILGHSIWEPDQLEAEMMGYPPYSKPYWVTADVDMEFFYGKLDAIAAWDKAIRKTASERSTFLLDKD